MKRILVGSLAVMIVLVSASFAVWASTRGPRQIEVHQGVLIEVNGEILQTENEPFIHEGRTYLPLRAVVEALGGTVAWDATTNKVIVKGKVAATPDPKDPYAILAVVEQSMALQKIRAATAKYQDVEVAKSDGFTKASGMLPNHGIHFTKLTNFLRTTDLTRPAGLVYVEKDGVWSLVAVEYTAILQPDKPLIPGGQWAKHEAACHYKDGNELLESNYFNCPKTHPKTGSEYDSWHPGVWTFHVWAWYPNPNGLFSAENPLLVTYNVPGVEVDHHHHD